MRQGITGTFLMLMLSAPTFVAAQDKAKQKVIQIDAFKVEGRIQKPEAFYILQRSELNFKGLEPKKELYPNDSKKRRKGAILGWFRAVQNPAHQRK